MDDATLTAVHRREAKRLATGLHAFGRYLRRHAQFFDAEGAVVVGIESDARVIVRVHAQGFLRDVFEGEQKLGAVAQDEIDVIALKLDDDVGGFKFRIAPVSGFEREFQRQTGIFNYPTEKLFDPGTGLINRIFGLQAFFLPSLMGVRPGVAGAVLLKNHCCATPTMLLVR